VHPWQKLGASSDLLIEAEHLHKQRDEDAAAAERHQVSAGKEFHFLFLS